MTLLKEKGVAFYHTIRIVRGRDARGMTVGMKHPPTAKEVAAPIYVPAKVEIA